MCVKFCLLPFGPAAELIGRFPKVEVSEATVRRVSENSGQAWVELQGEEVERLESELELEEAPQGPALQQLSVDGAMVPLARGEWAEVKTLVMGTIEGPGHTGEVHAQDLSYFPRMLDQQSFSRLATVEMHRRGTERAGTVCAVVDGAEWQQKFIDLHCPDAVRVLDWCHAAEYLSKAGQAAFGAGTAEAREWLGIQLRQLKHGEPEERKKAVKGRRTKPRAPERPAETKTLAAMTTSSRVPRAAEPTPGSAAATHDQNGAAPAAARSRPPASHPWRRTTIRRKHLWPKPSHQPHAKI